MPEELQLYYYALDPSIENYEILLPNSKSPDLPSSDYGYGTYPLYNDKFEKAGTLARVIPQPYVEGINFGQYYQNFIIGDELDTITVVFNYIVKDGTGLFFPPGVKIPFTYLYGSGKYFNKKITGYLLPFDNDVRSRVYVFFIE
jgi:hypothetical protein